MRWPSFHHPDWCARVAGRRLGAELLDLLEFMGEFSVRGGWALIAPRGDHGEHAYRMAAYRLRKAGLVTGPGGPGQQPFLRLTARGRGRLEDLCRPERWWQRKWNGLWYVLVYDVPESNRGYRAGLRSFLKRLRLGYLQDSVWVGWRDICPDFSDLAIAGGVSPYAFLFESRTVLGQSPEEVVRAAWDMERLEAAQRWYLSVSQENENRLSSLSPAVADLAELARAELNAYRAVMQDDPLLPRSLWPRGYQGEKVYRQHCRFQKAVARRLGPEIGCHARQ